MTERSPEAIGARLAVLRQIQDGNLTQADFARSLDIAFTTYNNYERGVSRPRVDEALRVVDRYHVTLDWIYTGNPAGLPVHIYQKLISAAA